MDLSSRVLALVLDGKIKASSSVFNPIFRDAWVWHHHSEPRLLRQRDWGNHH